MSLKGLRLTAPSSAPICNEGAFARVIKMKCVQLILVRKLRFPDFLPDKLWHPTLSHTKCCLLPSVNGLRASNDVAVRGTQFFMGNGFLDDRPLCQNCMEATEAQ